VSSVASAGVHLVSSFDAYDDSVRAVFPGLVNAGAVTAGAYLLVVSGIRSGKQCVARVGSKVVVDRENVAGVAVDGAVTDGAYVVMFSETRPGMHEAGLVTTGARVLVASEAAPVVTTACNTGLVALVTRGLVAGVTVPGAVTVGLSGDRSNEDRPGTAIAGADTTGARVVAVMVRRPVTTITRMAGA
jgi:hypothetical protein